MTTNTNTYYVLSGEGSGEGTWETVRLTPAAIQDRLTLERCGGDRWAHAYVLLHGKAVGTGSDIETGTLRDLRGCGAIS